MNFNPFRPDVLERGSLLRRLTLAILALLLSGMALGFALYWIPLYINWNVRTQTYDIEATNATRYQGKMYEAFKGYLAPYAEELITLAQRGAETRLTREDLEQLLVLPTAQEAFWVDISSGTGLVAGNILPISSILSDTSLTRDKNPHRVVPLPDTLKPWKSLRYSFISLNGVDYTIAIRDIRRKPREMSHEFVGLIIPTDPIVKEGVKNLNRLFADPLETEFQGQSSDGKQGSFGVLRGSDTLFWWGERDVPIVNEKPDRADTAWHHPGWVGQISGLNITIMAKAAEPARTRYAEKTSKQLARLSRSIVVMGLVFIYLLGFSLVLANRQSRRNQIALGHLAHSVKTPVARLQLAADILEGGQVSTPEEERKIIQTVSGECRQLRRAVENAALSLEGGKIAIHKEPGDLAEVVRETIDAWRQSFDQVGIRFNVEGVEKSLQFSFDRDKIRLALDNLIDNALRHTYLNMKNLKPGDAAGMAALRDDATVTVALREDAAGTAALRIFLSVSDSGAGIPKADMKNVFKRFSRSGKDPLTGVSGLGLGLALVKEIAEGHGGKVVAGKATNGGAILTMEFKL